MCTFIEQIRYGLVCLYLKGKGLWQLSFSFFGFATGAVLEVLVLRLRTLSQQPHDCGHP